MIRVKERALESAVCFCKPFDLTLKAVLCQTEVEEKRPGTAGIDD